MEGALERVERGLREVVAGGGARPRNTLMKGKLIVNGKPMQQ